MSTQDRSIRKRNIKIEQLLSNLLVQLCETKQLWTVVKQSCIEPDTACFIHMVLLTGQISHTHWGFIEIGCKWSYLCCTYLCMWMWFLLVYVSMYPSFACENGHSHCMWVWSLPLYMRKVHLIVCGKGPSPCMWKRSISLYVRMVHCIVCENGPSHCMRKWSISLYVKMVHLLVCRNSPSHCMWIWFLPFYMSMVEPLADSRKLRLFMRIIIIIPNILKKALHAHKNQFYLT